MTDEERTSRFCSQMKCEELHGQKLSFTAPHFKCCFLSFHWNLVAFFGTLLHAHSQVGSFFVCGSEMPSLPIFHCTLQEERQDAVLKHHSELLEDSFGCLWGESGKNTLDGVMHQAHPETTA